MRRVRVVLCGSNYGRSYLPAITGAPSTLELAGILARGSSRSKALALQYGVPLYHSPEDLPARIDIACVALPSSASEVALHLLDRGIHVLCEHPQPPALLKAAFRIARKRGISFHINGHFADLPAPRAFLGRIGHLRSREKPRFVQILAADRAAYAALDVLQRCLGSLRPFRLCTISGQAPFVTLDGTAAGTPTLLSIQNRRTAGHRGLRDADPGYLIDFRITVLFRSGTLTLLSMAGPIVWNENLARAADGTQSLSRTLTPPVRAGELLGERIASNRRAIDSLIAAAGDGRTPPNQIRARLLEISDAWQTLGGQLRR